jgi:hypothetical protein
MAKNHEALRRSLRRKRPAQPHSPEQAPVKANKNANTARKQPEEIEAAPEIQSLTRKPLTRMDEDDCSVSWHVMKPTSDIYTCDDSSSDTTDIPVDTIVARRITAAEALMQMTATIRDAMAVQAANRIAQDSTTHLVQFMRRSGNLLGVPKTYEVCVLCTSSEIDTVKKLVDWAKSVDNYGRRSRVFHVTKKQQKRLDEEEDELYYPFHTKGKPTLKYLAEYFEDGINLPALLKYAGDARDVVIELVYKEVMKGSLSDDEEEEENDGDDI